MEVLNWFFLCNLLLLLIYKNDGIIIHDSNRNVTAHSWLSYVRPIGRTIKAGDQRMISDWPLTGMHFQFIAKRNLSEIEIIFEEYTNAYFVMMVNCQREAKFHVNRTNPFIHHSLTTATNLTYDIRVQKVTEAWTGTMDVNKVHIDGGHLLHPQHFHAICPKRLKFLSIGDSFTAAYGSEESWPCSFSMASEDASHSYASNLAEYFSAELHLIAWSGMGLVKNIMDKENQTGNPLPFYLNRTLAKESADGENHWLPQRFQPDVITIFLGINDYSGYFHPSDESFQLHYLYFIRSLQLDYPHAKFLLLSIDARVARNVEKVAWIMNVSHFDLERVTRDSKRGCDWHPHYLMHQNISQALISVISRLIPG